MKIPLLPIECSKKVDKSILEKIEYTLTEDDIEFFNSLGWSYFDEEFLIEYRLPTLGEEKYYSTRYIVAEIKGKRYKIEFQESDRYEPWEVEGKSLFISETDDALTPAKPYGHYQLFGKPTWKQGAYLPADLRGQPCYIL